MAHRESEVKDVETIKFVQRLNYPKSKDRMSWRAGSKSKHRFKCFKCDITEHSVRNCMPCAPAVTERLIRQRRFEAERKVRKSVKRKSSGEVMTTSMASLMSIIYCIQDRIADNVCWPRKGAFGCEIKKREKRKESEIRPLMRGYKYRLPSVSLQS